MSNAPSLDYLRQVTAADMAEVNDLIKSSLTTQVPLIDQIGHYIVNSGGKRLRPMLTVMAARACGYQGDKHFTLAAIIEFIHTATLLHDDVVDESLLRRGAETANAVFGDHASVLVGDFLYSRAFQLMVKVGEMRVMDIMADTTNIISEGEVLQLVNCNDPSTDEQRYIKVIDCKTGKLFEAATRVGAVISGQTEQYEQAVAAYGIHLGRAYQLVDDVLDYRSSAEEMGKNVGDDLAEGKPTLPLIYAMQNSSEEDAKTIRHAIETGGLDQLDEILKIVESSGALDYTADMAKAEADKAVSALDSLPASDWKQAMCDLAIFSVSRSF